MRIKESMFKHFDFRPTEEESCNNAVLKCFNDLVNYDGIAYLFLKLGHDWGEAKGRDRDAIFRYALRLTSDCTLWYLGEKAFLK